jgi:archaellum component FlaC
MASNNILANMSVVLGADVSAFQKAMAVAKKEMKSLVQYGENMKNLGKSMSTYVTAPLLALGAVGVVAWDKQAKAVAQVENGLRSTGNAAKLTSKQLQDAASALQGKSVFGDEEILQKVTTQLLTFGNISGNVFKQTQQAAVDLSAKLGTDLQGSAIMLGKALNDPVQGLSALRRVGISFTEQQIAQVKALQDSGKLVEAQTLILKELEVQYGGTAEAAAKTGMGPMVQLKNILGDITEEFGKIITEALNPFIAKLREWAEGFQKLSPEVKKTIVIVAGLAAAIGPLLFVVGSLITLLPTLAAGFAVFSGPVAIVTLSIIGLTAAIGGLMLSTKAMNTTALKGWQEQKSKVQELEQSFIPLVDRHEELSKKTNLTKEEQEELRKVIAQIAKVTPEAVTEFDKYGNAMSVSSGKAREFLKLQKDIAAVKNKEAIDEQVKNLRKLDEEVTRINYNLEKGTKTRTFRDEFTTTTREVALTAEEVNKLRNRLNELGTTRNGIQGFINELKGIPPVLDEVAGSADDAAEALKKIAEATKSLEENLALIAKKFQVFGDAYETAKEKAAALKSGIVDLLKEGLSPQSALVQKLARQWKTLSDTLKGYEDRGKDIIELQGKLAQKMVIPAKLELIPINQDDLKPAVDAAADAFDSFSSTVSQLITGTLGDAFVQLGNIIAASMSGGHGAMANALKGFMMVMLDFMGNFGKALIAFALAKLNFEKLLTSVGGAPAAIAAGVAMVALAGVAKAALSKGPAYSGTTSAPQSASPNYSNPGGPGYGDGRVTFTISGDSLQGVLSRNDYRGGRFSG